MTASIPPIVKLAERVLVGVEQAACGFPRKHRYTLGSDLRKQAMGVARLTHRAWRDHAGRRSWLKQLTQAVDDLQLTIDIGCQLRAFRSFGQFEDLARLAKDLGKQCGGWHRHQKEQHPQGQNAPAGSPSQRAKTLSTRAARSGRART
jgi:hypothetical protein